MDEKKEILRATFLKAVETYLRDNDPPETRLTLSRLMAEGWSAEDAKMLIAQCVAVEIFQAGKFDEEFNEARFKKNLANLPNEPTEDLPNKL